jgi:tetratricopeptide (TPR) repeat protein
MIRQRQLFWGLLFGAFLALIVTVAIYIKPSSLPNEEALPVSNGGTPLEPSSEKVTSVTDSSTRDSSQSTYRPSNWNKITIKPLPGPTPPSIPDSKLERITDFYASLNSAGYTYPYEGPHPKEIEILTEGMDTLSGAQYLKALSHFDYAREYAERALAENPGSFEALLLRTQLLPLDREDEREAGFRQLVDRDGHSVEALVGLAWVISDRNPSEAIEYVQRAITIDPSNGGAYRALGSSYERLGRYDEALAAHQKAFQIDPGQVSAVHIRAIQEGNPIIKPIAQKSESQLPEEGLSQEPSSQAPQETSASPIPDSSEGVESETTFDSEPLIEPPE